MILHPSTCCAASVLHERFRPDRFQCVFSLIVSILYCLNFSFFFSSDFENSAPLVGRPEHTDSVTHSFTWHAQCAGSKKWHIRPTDDLVKQCPAAKKYSGGIEITVNEGDLFLIDTRLWWHCTSLPQNPLSVSYARDVYTDKSSDLCMPCMTNVDGLYAPHDISAGDVIFTEEEMPEGEMGRSENPNCEVVEVGDENDEQEEGQGEGASEGESEGEAEGEAEAEREAEGESEGGEEEEEERGSSMAVVALRDISAGEFFTIADTDDEGENEEEEEEEDEL